MDGTGSPEYVMTWKSWDMPSGPPICALRGSRRRTSDKGCTGWPTPTQDDPNNGTRKSGQFQSLTRVAGWASPSARDLKDTPGMETEGINPDGSKRSRLDQLPRQAALVGWNTPTAQDGSRGSKPERPQDTGIPLSQQVAGTTPKSSETQKGSTEGYLLNHRFSLWLQGFPAEWASCGERVGRSSRKSRRNSSGPTSRPK